MSKDYHSSNGFDEFFAAKEKFKLLTSGCRDRIAGMEHSEIESLLDVEGRDLIRCILQGHLDRLSLEETILENVEGSDGAVLGQRRFDCQRSLMTIFGEVTVSRIRYGSLGQKSLHPMDAKLNLPDDKFSHNLRMRVAEESAKTSFDETVASITKTSGAKIAKLQAEQLTARSAQDFEDFYRHRERTPATCEEFLALSLDGKGIVMKQDSLREQTQKKAAREEHKKKTRISPGEKRNRKRMATVAAVYDVTSHLRTADEIMSTEEKDDQPTHPKPKPTNKRVWASAERSPEDVAKEVFDEATARDPDKRRKWVVLIDGQKQQLKNVEKQVAERGLEGVATIILDFIHVLEYLWKAAYCLLGENNEKTESWVQTKALAILQGRASHVAGGIRSSASKLGLTTKQRESADKCADYLLNNARMLKYDKYLRLGMPIATGVIEGACRHLIKDRLDITGARWSLAGAEAVLKLRSLRSSGDFEKYWLFHIEKEKQRCHTSKYRHPLLLSAA